MQKLTLDIGRMIGKNSGSALVTAVALAMIMAIAGLGFLLVTTNSINNDSAAYENDKAFHAAESCALIASKWVQSTVPANWGSFPAANFQSIFINGLYVTVTVTINGNQAVVRSAAYTSSTLQDAAHFKKRVVITLQNG